VGRIDDVLNVAGHRLGTMEIESALVAHPRVAEAAVVGRPHEIKGEAVFAYVVCRGALAPGEARTLGEELRQWVARQLSPIARPEEIRFADGLPKTRSGKIMRRLLRAIARGEEIAQDISTLENPLIVAQLRGEAPAGAPVPSPQRRRAARKRVKQSRKKASSRRVALKGAPRKAARKRSRNATGKAMPQPVRKPGKKAAKKPAPSARSRRQAGRPR
jgi:hypothetical protein